LLGRFQNAAPDQGLHSFATQFSLIIRAGAKSRFIIISVIYFVLFDPKKDGTDLTPHAVIMRVYMEIIWYMVVLSKCIKYEKWIWSNVLLPTMLPTMFSKVICYSCIKIVSMGWRVKQYFLWNHYIEMMRHGYLFSPLKLNPYFKLISQNWSTWHTLYQSYFKNGFCNPHIRWAI